MLPRRIECRFKHQLNLENIRSLSTEGTSSTKAARSSTESTLFFTGQEADRLAKLAAAKPGQEDLLDAANALLIVSRPSPSLAEAIATNAPETQSLHRAFVGITSCCLDVLERETTTADVAHVVLDRALAVARRAHCLNLPFHLPLYQRIMSVVSKICDSETDLTAIITDVSTWASTLLSTSHTDSRLFAPALKTMIERQQFGTVVSVLMNMQLQHVRVDFGLSTELLLQLREFARAAILDPTRPIPEKDLSNIVSLLESSVMEGLQQQQENEPTDRQLYEHVKAILDRMDPQQVEDLFASFLGTDEDGDGGDEDDSDEFEEEVVTQAPLDPLDLAINSILTKGVANNEFRNVLMDLHAHAAGSTGQVRVMGFYSDVRNIYQANAESDSDNSDAETGREDMLISRMDPEMFPDVVSQVLRANKGRGLHFTKKYSEFLWMRDCEEEFGDNFGIFVDSDDDDDSDGEDDF